MRLLVGWSDIREEGRVQPGAFGRLDPRFVCAVAEAFAGLDLAAGIVALAGLALLEGEFEHTIFNRDLIFRPGAVLMRAIVPAVRNVPELAVNRVEIFDERSAVDRALRKG
ncbi:hypothetical protein D3C87_1552190 [compost metagenome]